MPKQNRRGGNGEKMKIRIEIDDNLIEDEVVIRCSNLTDQIASVQRAVSDVVNASRKFTFYKDSTEYYLELDEILFLRQGIMVSVHIPEMIFTRQNISFTNSKIYFPDFL